MSFEDEKFLGSWGAIFCSFLVLVNFDFAPSFWWWEFLTIATLLGLFVMLKFRKNINPSVTFYRYGLLLWGLLLIIYSSFALFLLGRAFGEKWLWGLVPLWIALTITLIRGTVHLKDGTTSPNTRLISWMATIGASVSGVLTFYVSKATISFVLAVVMDILFSFVMAAYVTVWLRRLMNMKRHTA
jgi:hypothetical protein